MPESLAPSTGPGALPARPPAAPPWNEYFLAPDRPRPAAAPLLDQLNRLGQEELRARRDSAQHILRDHGVRFDALDRDGVVRPWELDLLPLPVQTSEWQSLETGLQQRTRLLNAVLADCHGPRDLVRDGLLPPALLHANPDFLRPCCGIRPAKDLYIIIHAIELGRAPDGSWWVLTDRTQAPLGTGYVLENRIVISRVLPDLFRDSNVQRLAPFFHQERETLARLQPAPERPPTIVVLTPGPENPGYFEHAYLARYLSFPLVEGADLTVRNSRVFLKTLEGLQPVDVILRRVSDASCDPLELRTDSLVGVPGLLQAARAGNVAIANALGAGLAESPALLAFLPRICTRLLGEDLAIPTVATWWCGQESECQHVLAHLDELVIRRAFSALGSEPVIPARLTPRDRDALVHAIRRDPHTYVGQELVRLSRAPLLQSQPGAAVPIVFRAFVCAGPDHLTVLPGALARLAGTADDLFVPSRTGGWSKDTWILTDQPVHPSSLLPPPASGVRLERAAAEVPSRVADNLFWLGRYAERLEDTLRLLRCTFARLVGEARYEITPQLDALLQLLAHLELLEPHAPIPRPNRKLEREILALLFQSHRLGTVREILDRLRRIAWTVRDRFSTDTWRVFEKLQADSRPRSDRPQLVEALGLLNNLLVDLAAFSGLEMENMTRGHGWRFLDLGRRLERATNIASLIRAGLAVHSADFPILEPLLEIADSVMTYRRRYFGPPQITAVLDLLLADETNPRSFAFQLDALAVHAPQLPQSGDAANLTAESAHIDHVRSILRNTGLDAFQPTPPPATLEPLAQALEQIGSELGALSNTITHHYFSHAEAHVTITTTPTPEAAPSANPTESEGIPSQP